MKPALVAILAAVVGAGLLWVGVAFGVSYERYMVKMWRTTALECIDGWIECKEVCKEGIRL